MRKITISVVALSRFNQKKQLKLVGYLTIFRVLYPISFAFLAFNSGIKAIAQVTADTSLGTENSVVNDTDPQKFLIEGGARPEQGQNLFHSFEEFNVNEGQTVYFVNPPGVDLILSRVTGSNPSNILDKLGVIGSADLILLNPNGIFFGKNASLDINGSFLATTANSILFEDGIQFSATDSSVAPLLTVKTPIGLQFANRAASITNQSISQRPVILPNGSEFDAQVGLEIAGGRTLTFVGGDIRIEGGLFNGSGGNIELASIAANNRVGLEQTEKGWALNYQNTQDFRDIKFDRFAGIFWKDGEIKFQGRHISVKDGSQIGINQNINITINAAESVEVSGFDDSLGFTLFSGFYSASVDTADAGNIAINTGKLIVKDGGRIETTVGSLRTDGERVSTGTGNAGFLEINASESVEISDIGSSLSTSTEGFGDSGTIIINSPLLIVQDGATITADSIGQNSDGETIITGKVGNIFINTDNLFLSNQSLISTNAQSTDGGNIIIDTDNLVAFNNGDITANAAQGRGGRVEINARGIFGIEAREELTPASDITASSELGVEFSGEIIINTPEVETTSGLIEIPALPIDAETIITQNSCALTNGRFADGSSFIVVGRGGLPPSADDPLINQGRIVDWVSSTQKSSEFGVRSSEFGFGISNKEEKPLDATVSEFGIQTVSHQKRLRQAQGLVKTEDGKIFLTANALVVNPHTGAIAYPSCQD